MSDTKFPASARCDICNFRDGHSGLMMVQCSECKLCVHRECYGMPTYKRRQLVCWACQAVGRSFQVDALDENERRLSLIQLERPDRCDLCSVSGGNHGMHPLYDNSGSRAKQLVVNNGGERRLGWGHTLCCFLLSTRGLLYGCGRDGTYEQDDDETSDDDDRSLNPELTDTTRETDEDYGSESMPIHHFVYHLPDKNGDEDQWCKAVRCFQKGLKCSLCGKNDDPDKVLRIPVQCFANNDDEYELFKHRHTSLPDDETCTVAMHIGCARWGGDNPNDVERVFYYPGKEGDNADPMKGVYCTLHAEDLCTKLRQKREEEESSRQAERKNSRAVAMARRTSQGVVQSERPTVDNSVLPSLAKKAPFKPRRKSRVYSTNMKKTQPHRSISVETTLKGPKKGRRLSDNLDKDLAAPVSGMERPTLAKQRRILANNKSHVSNSALERMKREVGEKMLVTVKEKRPQVMKEQKTRWKRELSELSTEDFKSQWKQVREYAREVVCKQEPSIQLGAPSNPIELDRVTSSSRREKNNEDGGAVQPAEKKQRLALIAESIAKPSRGERTKEDERETQGVQAFAVPETDSGGPVKIERNKDYARADAPPLDPKSTPSPWSHLALGPHYKGERYRFGEWDEVERI